MIRQIAELKVVIDTQNMMTIIPLQLRATHKPQNIYSLLLSPNDKEKKEERMIEKSFKYVIDES